MPPAWLSQSPLQQQPSPPPPQQHPQVWAPAVTPPNPCRGILAECDTNSPSNRWRPKEDEKRQRPKPACLDILSPGHPPPSATPAAVAPPSAGLAGELGSPPSPSPSTVDLHGPASLAHTSSAPSLLSNGGPLELSESLSNPSLTVSTSSSRDPLRQSNGSSRAGSSQGLRGKLSGAGDGCTHSPVPALALGAAEPGRRTPEPPVWEARKAAGACPSTPPVGLGAKACEEARKLADAAAFGTPTAGCGVGGKALQEKVGDENAPPEARKLADSAAFNTPQAACGIGGKVRQEGAGDENVPPEEAIPTPRTFQLQAEKSGEAERTDPLAPTVKALTVTTLRSFFENHASQVANSRRDSGKGTASPSVPGAANALRFGRSQSASAARQLGGGAAGSAPAVGRLRKAVTRQHKLMEDSSALLEELTARVRGLVPDAALLRAGRSSGSSDSEATTEQGEREEEDEELALLRSYNESSSNLWRMHRQTVRLLLEHLDRLGLGEEQAAGGMAPGCSAALPNRSGFPAVAPLQLPVAGHTAGCGLGLVSGTELRTVEEPAGEPELGA